MKSKDPIILKSSLEFASKFGFLPKEIFYDFLCPRGNTQKYINWKDLVEDGYFRTSKHNMDLLYLTPKGLRLCAGKAVRNRYYYYLNHDSLVARVLFALISTGLCVRYWTEAELQMQPWDALSILGISNLVKLPDLVVDLKTSSGSMRFAIEVEASRKSNHKYDQIALAYLSMKKVNLVMFFCETDKIEMQVRRAFNDDIFLKYEKNPGTVLLNDFQLSGLNSKVRLLDREFKLNDFIQKLTQLEMKSEPNQNRSGVRFSKIENQEGA